MTFDKNKIFKQALKVIDKDDDVLTFEGILDKLDCCKQTFYNLFPTELDEWKTLKKKLDSKLDERKRILLDILSLPSSIKASEMLQNWEAYQ